MSTPTTWNVTILGAGVSGLTVARTLQQRASNSNRYSIKILATHLPSDLSIDYTSPWAGAHWRSYADIQDTQQQQFDTETFERLSTLAREGNTEAGVMFVVGHDFWQVKPKNFEDPWFKRLVPNYRHLPKNELPPGIEFGIAYTTVTVNTPKYLRFLQKQVEEAGAIIEQVTIASLKELSNIKHKNNKSSDIIINCSGLGSRILPGVHDHQMFPTRGQIVIVKVPEDVWPVVKNFTMEKYDEGSSMGSGTLTYVIPRENGEIVLGGTMQHWNREEVASEEITRDIINRVMQVKPELFSKATVLRSCVGLRPNRRGGVRVEAKVEQLDWNERRDPHVCVVAHNYGHAGFGIQASVGCARKTVELIEGCLEGLVESRKSAKTLSKL